ncbi:MAG: hypothetical protein RI947_406 [Candidatus Parcubacteria bacterium]|jgi:multiple sugar transport system substrate-binding protein
MDNNKTNSGGNQSPDDFEQPKPIFESVPVEETPAENPSAGMQPEELAPEVATSDEAFSSAPPPMPPEFGGPPADDNKTKYIIIGGAVLFFIIILVILLRLIFGGKKEVATQPVVLSYWGLWEDTAVFKPLIDEYQKKYPNVTINYEKWNPQDDYRQKLIARSKNGKGPDIFRFHNTWLPQLNEIAAPLPASIMTNDEFEKTFYPIHAQDLKVDTYYYGLPLEIDGLVLIYNDTLFANAGINKAPSNWDELINDVEKLTVKDKDGKLITSGVAIGTAGNVEHFSEIFGLMLRQNGGDMKSLNQQEAVQTLEVYRKFAEPPNPFWDETMPNSITAFIQEKVAMILAPSWQVAVIKTANPDLKIKVAEVPNVPGAENISMANYWVEGVSKVSKNQLEAWKFLRFLVEKENMTKLYELQSKTRLFGEPYSRIDLADKLDKDPYVGAVIRQGKNYFSYPMVTRTYDSGLNDQIVNYLRDAINATENGVSYQEALQTAKKGIDTVLDTYKIK